MLLYSCRECPKYFESKSQLSRHSQVRHQQGHLFDKIYCDINHGTKLQRSKLRAKSINHNCPVRELGGGNEGDASDVVGDQLSLLGRVRDYQFASSQGRLRFGCVNKSDTDQRIALADDDDDDDVACEDVLDYNLAHDSAALKRYISDLNREIARQLSLRASCQSYESPSASGFSKSLGETRARDGASRYITTAVATEATTTPESKAKAATSANVNNKSKDYQGHYKSAKRDGAQLAWRHSSDVIEKLNGPKPGNELKVDPGVSQTDVGFEINLMAQDLSPHLVAPAETSPKSTKATSLKYEQIELRAEPTTLPQCQEARGKDHSSATDETSGSIGQRPVVNECNSCSRRFSLFESLSHYDLRGDYYYYYYCYYYYLPPTSASSGDGNPNQSQCKGSDKQQIIFRQLDRHPDVAAPCVTVEVGAPVTTPSQTNQFISVRYEPHQIETTVASPNSNRPTGQSSIERQPAAIGSSGVATNLLNSQGKRSPRGS